MLPFAVVPIILLVVAALLWTWWTSRQDRDPASSVDSFNRALTAMQPGSAPAKSRRRATQDRDTTAPDPTAATDETSTSGDVAEDPEEVR